MKDRHHFDLLEEWQGGDQNKAFFTLKIRLRNIIANCILQMSQNMNHSSLLQSWQLTSRSLFVHVFVPVRFVPVLVLSGNDSSVDGLVNFEKLRMIAKEIRHVVRLTSANMDPALMFRQRLVVCLILKTFYSQDLTILLQLDAVGASFTDTGHLKVL